MAPSRQIPHTDRDPVALDDASFALVPVQKRVTNESSDTVAFFVSHPDIGLALFGVDQVVLAKVGPDLRAFPQSADVRRGVLEVSHIRTAKQSARSHLQGPVFRADERVGLLN
jgi:hypothetical protein